MKINGHEIPVFVEGKKENIGMAIGYQDIDGIHATINITDPEYKAKLQTEIAGISIFEKEIEGEKTDGS